MAAHDKSASGLAKQPNQNMARQSIRFTHLVIVIVLAFICCADILVDATVVVLATNFNRANGPPTGATAVTLTSTNFGVDSSADMRVDHTSCESAVWLSTTSALCKTSNQRGIAACVMASFGYGVNKLSHTISFTFDDYFISSAMRSNHAPTAASTVTVLGNAMDVTWTSKAQIGSSGCEIAHWVSGSSTRCKMPNGASLHRDMIVTVANIRNCLSSALTFDSVQPSSLMRGNGPASGGVSVTVTGMSLSVSDQSSTAGISATVCEGASWHSASSLRAKIPNALMPKQKVMMSSARRHGTMTMMFSIDDHSVTQSVGNTPPTAGVSVFIIGKHYGHKQMSPAGQLGETRNEVQTWIGDTSFKIKTSRGVSRRAGAVLTIQLRLKTSTNMHSYDLTLASAIARCNGPSTGAASLTVTGAGFGTTMTTAARLGLSGCIAADWAADTVVRLKAPTGNNNGRTLRVTVALNVGGTKTRAFSFDPMHVSSWMPTNAPVTGSTSLTVSGCGCGTVDFCGAGRIGHTAAQSLQWKSDSTSRLKVPPGSALARGLRVTIASLRGGTASRAMSYDRVAAVTSMRTNAPLTGAVTLSVTGSGLQGWSESATVRVGGSAAEVSSWGGSDSSVSLKLAAGAGARITLHISTALQTGSATRVFSFDHTTVSGITMTNAPPTAMTSITMSGSHAGPVPASAAMRVGRSACIAAQWTADSSVRCKVARGVGRARGITATVKGLDSRKHYGTATEMFTFNEPVASSAVVHNSPSTGGVSLTISGSSGSEVDHSSGYRLGGTSCDSSLWLSESTVRCKTPAGAGTILPQSTSVAAASSSQSKALTFDTHTSSSVLVVNSPPTGGVSITMAGTGMTSFDATIAVRVGNTGTEGAGWVSQTSVRTKSARGHRRSHGVTLSSTRRPIAQVTRQFTYNALHADSMGPGNAPPTGSAHVTVYGKALGSLDATVSGRTGATTCELAKWGSDSTLLCKTSAAKAALRQGVTVSLVKHRSTRTQSLTIDPPHAIGPTATIPSTGGLEIMVSAGLLGLIHGSQTARIGGTGSMLSAWVSDSALRIKAASGTGPAVTLEVSAGVGRSGCRTTAMTYTPPSISTPLRSNMPPTGAVSVTMSGTGFGVVRGSLSGRIANTACGAATWVSDSGMRCRVPWGIGTGRRIGSSVASNKGTTTSAMTFDRPISLDVAPHNLPTTGAVTLTVSGTGFCAFSSDFTISVGSTACASPTWQSESSVRCISASGNAATSLVRVTDISARSTTIVSAVTYDAPSITEVSVSNGPGTGQVSISIYGSGFGVVDRTVSVNFGATKTEVAWLSDSSLRLRLPPGSLSVVTVAASVSGVAVGETSNFVKDFTYDGAVCGDGIRASTEDCDDMNSVIGDGCGRDCKVEAGYTCEGGDVYGNTDVCLARCGDGLRRGSEACDDGNFFPGDGCSSVCTVEQGWFCVAAGSGVPDDCSRCGDGRQLGDEQCDDGNVLDGDGCSSTCEVELNYACTPPIGTTPSVCVCKANFYGTACLTPCTARTTCGGHGRCDATSGSCLCDLTYFGTGCEQQNSPIQSVTVDVGPAGGNVFVNGTDADGEGLLIPEGAVTTVTKFAVARYQRNSLPVPVSQESEIEFSSDILTFHPSGEKFTTPVTASIRYSGGSGQHVAVYRYNVQASVWMRVGGIADDTTGIVRVKLNSFSSYAAMRLPGTAKSAIVDAIDDSDDDNDNRTIGVIVGVSFAFLFVIAVLFTIWYRMQKRRELDAQRRYALQQSMSYQPNNTTDVESLGPLPNKAVWGDDPDEVDKWTRPRGSGPKSAPNIHLSSLAGPASASRGGGAQGGSPARLASMSGVPANGAAGDFGSSYPTMFPNNESTAPFMSQLTSAATPAEALRATQRLASRSESNLSAPPLVASSSIGPYDIPRVDLLSSTADTSGVSQPRALAAVGVNSRPVASTPSLDYGTSPTLQYLQKMKSQR